ncbi:hypothetical protein HOC13_04370 [Candidatus Woesearchaeota archaeon]|jgi:hypothetical protein|nr:hypothetical protein [Candidatus Woesearchaeota archaeon]
MERVEIIDVIGKVNFPVEDPTAKMIQLVREVAKEVASKFSKGELELYAHLKHEKRVGVLYNPPNTHWYHRFISPTSRRFMSFINKDIKEIFVKVFSDPEYIDEELVTEVKKIINKCATEINIKIKEV